MYKTLAAIAIALAVLIGVPLALFATSDNYNYCAANQGQYAEPPKGDNTAPVFHGPISNPTFIRLLVRCSGAYASQNADAITAIATVVATLVAIFLAIIAALQIGFLKRSERTALKLTEISRRQMAISGKQTDILEKQKEIQRQEFLITHRPRITVRSVAFVPDQGNYRFVFRFTNTGNLDARIRGILFSIAYVDAAGSLAPIPVQDFPFEDTTLVPGSSRTEERQVSIASIPVDLRMTRVIINGSVHYMDANNLSRTTSFGRDKAAKTVFARTTPDVEDMNYED